MNALEPLKTASKSAIDKCMERMREQWSEFASDLKGVGSFDIEGAIESNRWDYHMEAWNKARISIEKGHAHIVCAGLSRPEGEYTIEDFIEEMLAAGNEPEFVLQNVLGYNIHVSNEIAHALEGHKPRATDVFDSEITDYLGKTTRVVAHESQALYPVSRILGETSKPSNANNIFYLSRKYDKDVDTSLRYLHRVDDTAIIKQQNEYGLMTVMEGI